MNLLTLGFDGQLEREYRDRHTIQTLPAVRAGLVLGIALYAVFGVLDLWIAPAQRASLWTIRYAVACPVMIGCLMFTFSRSYGRYREVALAATMAVAAAGIIAMVALIPPPGSYSYYAGLLLVIMAYCTLLRLRFVTALALAAGELATYVIVDVVYVRTSSQLLINNIFFLTAGSILGVAATYALEKGARHAFRQRRVIVARSQELQRKNEELARANAELARSREEVLRAGRRTALVFSALTEALPGTVLDDKYKLEERIGSGSFGTVYRATHLMLQQRVAVKVFRPYVSADGVDALERFRQEGVAACRLRHPNAVAVLDFGIAAESIAYLVMEFLEGRTLADEMRSAGRMTPARCAEILVPVCEVLAAAHAQGIVHRDIKPGNIFLHRDRTGEVVKVIDFGIAKLVGEPTDAIARPGTATGLLVGTPIYIAPERFAGSVYDGAVDVYAVGVTLYEMLSGVLPFAAAPNAWVRAMVHMLEPPTSLRTFDASIPDALDALVRRALARDPHDRPSANDLGLLLDAFQHPRAESTVTLAAVQH
jgi:hypothetical protein